MPKRKIIKIDENRCNGCGLCIPNCPEGALRVIDGKARLVSDLFCDGLGACIGHCPEGAITVEEREAGPYDENKVMENVVKQGKNVIRAHLEHLKDHGENVYLKQALDFLREKKIEAPGGKEDTGRHAHHVSGCPGSRAMDFGKAHVSHSKKGPGGVSGLKHWPVQIMLVPPHAPYLNNADLLIAADCVPFAYADFHTRILKDKALLVGCPKLDDAGFYKNKITQVLKDNEVRSVTCAHMEVPCCFGLVSLVKDAISDSGKDIPLNEVNISVRGQRIVT